MFQIVKIIMLKQFFFIKTRLRSSFHKLRTENFFSLTKSQIDESYKIHIDVSLLNMMWKL